MLKKLTDIFRRHPWGNPDKTMNVYFSESVQGLFLEPKYAEVPNDTGGTKIIRFSYSTEVKHDKEKNHVKWVGSEAAADKALVWSGKMSDLNVVNEAYALRKDRKLVEAIYATTGRPRHQAPGY